MKEEERTRKRKYWNSGIRNARTKKQKSKKLLRLRELRNLQSLQSLQSQIKILPQPTSTSLFLSELSFLNAFKILYFGSILEGKKQN
jgi:hypothetical protein